MPSEFYLQGPGAWNDATFTKWGNGRMQVVAEVGLTGCWDDIVSEEKAREIWVDLRSKGWEQVTNPRRDTRSIQMSIRG